MNSIMVVDDDFNICELIRLILKKEDFKVIVANDGISALEKLEIDKINLYFTTDLKQNSDTLEDTLVSIKLDPDTQKYQMVTEKIKLLS